MIVTRTSTRPKHQAVEQLTACPPKLTLACCSSELSYGTESANNTYKTLKLSSCCSHFPSPLHLIPNAVRCDFSHYTQRIKSFIQIGFLQTSSFLSLVQSLIHGQSHTGHDWEFKCSDIQPANQGSRTYLKKQKKHFNKMYRVWT